MTGFPGKIHVSTFLGGIRDGLYGKSDQAHGKDAFCFCCGGGVTDPVYHTSHYYIYVVQNNHLLHAILLFSLPHYGFDIGFGTYPKAK